MDRSRGKRQGQRPRCLFFPAGKCKNGTECRFPHVLPKDDPAAFGPGSSGGAHNQSIDLRTPSPMMAPATPNSANGGSKQPDYPNTSAGQSDAAKASVSPSPAATTLPPADLIGSAIVVTTNTGIRYEGILSSNEHSHPGINLRDAKDIVNPGSALIPAFFAPPQQVANWKKADPPPAPSTKVLDTFRTSDQTTTTPPNGANGNKVIGTLDRSSNATDMDVSTIKPEDLGVITSFRDYVRIEKEWMTQKKRALTEEDRDKRLSELVKFSQSFKLKQTIPDDLVPILAKDQDKQKAIVEKAAKDAEDRKARIIGVAIPPPAGAWPIPNTIPIPPPTPASVSSKITHRNSLVPPIPPFEEGPAKNAVYAGAELSRGSASPTIAIASPKPGAAGAQKRVPNQMTIPKIPPFDPGKRKNLEPDAAASSSPSNGATTPVSPGAASTPASKLNANASPFNPKAPAFKPGGPSPAPSGSSNKPAEAVSSNPTPERSAFSVSSSTTSLAPITDAGTMISWISPMPVKVNGHFYDVFEGTHRTAGKVALKKPRIGSVGCNEDVIRRFRQEAETWARLQHPHILEYLGTFQRDGHYYFISPFIENGTLVEYIALHRSANRVKLLCETADAITYLHQQDIVHGDIKASNILVGNNTQALLCDFGLTRTTDFRTLTAMRGAGTLRWQSPELWNGSPKSFKSDVYAFGMTIVEVLSGEVPFPDLQMDGAVPLAVFVEGRRPPKNPAESPAGLSYEKVWTVAAACWPTSSDERISMSEALHMIQEDPALTAI